MENKVRDFEVSKRQIIQTFDFNKGYDNVEFISVMTTDYYRSGRPYKLFKFRGQSKVQITFDLPENVKKPIRLHLTLTECCWSGMMDIFLNDTLWIEKHHSDNHENFKTQEVTLEVDTGRLKPKNNTISMRLRDDAEMVYWLSDAIIEVTHIVPSKLVDIAANAVAKMIRNGQIPKEAIESKQNFPREVTDLVYKWM